MNIDKSIIESERKLFRICECCNLEVSTVLFLIEHGICVVMSHICSKCFADNLTFNDFKYTYYPKINPKINPK